MTLVQAEPGTEDRLAAAWATPRGLAGSLTALNHKQVGQRFLVTAFVFFALGGIQSLFMRWQLGSAESTFLDAQTYNELFTMHGTTMMFLFAVPVGEALAMYILPLMLGTRDLPFPRLTAFGYYIYVLGGIFLYASFLFGEVPDGGWFSYVPLTGEEYSPGSSIDFWLLGVTFVEIATIGGAIELVVLILRNRAPGMKISRMPLLAWNVLVTGVAIIFAFPPLVVASVLLELDRTVGTHFYDPATGGDALLWQHLFWFFGHPEVYIVLLPGLGIVSTIVPVFARSRIVGYSLIAVSTVAIGILGFGVWVHHMFTTGLPQLGLAFFSLASLFIPIPSAIQISAWIATLWQGHVVWKTPLYYVVGFIVIFVAGGVTGVMVASVPFDSQAHDSYFVVAHFHYVLIGGMLFPVLGALYFWIPKMTGRLLSERSGRTSFWLTFIGFNLTFFPMHITGLQGMPRRVYTYAENTGWEPTQALATIGSIVLTTGLLVTLGTIISSARYGERAGDDPWGGETLDWWVSSPPPAYNFRAIPEVAGRSPLWDTRPFQPKYDPSTWQDELREPPAHVRQVVLTSLLDAAPEEVVTLPQRSWWPLLMASLLVLALLGVLVSVYPLALAGLLGATGVGIAWSWSREDEP
ncbi:cytochrome c oxidase subunit I [Blastococcus saxobsidens]|uniref:Cytochrome c oxidase subunit 1 n=1 Tax=Blastococcus saxobsidens (strain DD2) TaxID=1146883 RepID=H6RNJ7_BLASD|nr:cytochrome c oxidase subunit I [Blastococcus saxobsidens]CCG03944.1 Cytochrome c oxidase subunit 1 [Blastococcus saxobsidens DD2]